jgi:hypothetical protein
MGIQRLSCSLPLIATLFAITACSGVQSAEQSAPASSEQRPDQVVAEVDGRKITLRELDEKWLSIDPAEQTRVTQLLYQNRRNVLDQMVGDLLIDEAAKSAKQSTEQFLEQEMAKRSKPINEAEIKMFYDANKDRAQGRSYEELLGPIRTFLVSQREQQARAQLVDELKKKRGAAVRVTLDPPRREVQVAAHDPATGSPSAPVTIVEFSDYQ